MQHRLGSSCLFTAFAFAICLAGFVAHPAAGCDLLFIQPAAGPAAGGTEVQVYGDCLEETASVKFGGVPATSLLIQDFNWVTVTTPPHDGGWVELEVTTTAGETFVLADAFFYIPTMVVNEQVFEIRDGPP